MRFKKQTRAEQAGSAGGPNAGPGGRRRLRSSKLLWVAITVAFVGAVLWGIAAATHSHKSTAASGTAPSGHVGATGLAGAPQSSGAPEPVEDERLIAKAAPATMRVGLSFAAAYFLGWGIRAFAKMTLLLVGGLALLIIGLDQFGVLGIDWSRAWSSLGRAWEYVQGKAGEFKDVALGYLPALGSGAAGVFFGMRHK